MSRTYVHTPKRILFDCYIDDWKSGYSKHFNTRDRNTKRWSRRKLRHALIDEDGTLLTNALAERGRNSRIALDRYW